MEVLFNTLLLNKNKSRHQNTWLREQAAVAIIFRGDVEYSDDKNSFQSIKNLEVLFIQRQHSLRDPHSGQIAFPGGKCENQENDYDAAIRETLEEVGLDLVKRNAICITKLNHNAFVRTTSRRKLLYCSAFVFLIHDPNKDITLRVNPSEVRVVKWVPIQAFLDPQIKVKVNSQQFKINMLNKYQKGCMLAAVNIGMDEILYGLSFYFLVAVFILMREARFQKIISYAKFYEFSFKGPFKIPLTIGYNCFFKYNRISIVENNYYRFYAFLILLLILFVWVYF